MTLKKKTPAAAKKAPKKKASFVLVSQTVDKRTSHEEALSPPEPTTPKGQIFIAATRLFSEFGFKGTSTRAIANAAGVQQVMLNYYYGSKEQLYEEVLRYEGMTMLEVIFGTDPDHKSPEEMLIDSPIRLMTVLHDNPQWASLLRREIADGAVHLRRALIGVSAHGPLGANQHFHNAYKEAVRAGKAIDLPIEAVRECLLAIGYSAIYLAPLISMINERDFHDEKVWAEWKLTLSTILKQGLLITPPESDIMNGNHTIRKELLIPVPDIKPIVGNHKSNE